MAYDNSDPNAFSVDPQTAVAPPPAPPPPPQDDTGGLSPHQKALLDAIAGPESAGKYNIRYTPNGGATFNGFDDHPRVYERGPAGPSSAAGRYQFTASTWDGQAKKLGLDDFSPANQDVAAWDLANSTFKRKTGQDLEPYLQKNGLDGTVKGALGSTWAGLNANFGKSQKWYSASLNGDIPSGAQGAPVKGSTLPANLPTGGLLDQGLLAAAQQDQQKQGILSQAAQAGGGSGALLAAMQANRDQGGGGPVSPLPSIALAANGPIPPGMIPNPPVNGVGGMNNTGLPIMAANPPSQSGPVGNLAPQPGAGNNLIPSSRSTPPALALNRDTALNPITPPLQEGRSAATVAPPQGTNPDAPGFAGGVGNFFDKLQNSGIGNALTRAGAALMARDNPSGASALLTGLDSKKNGTPTYGDPYQNASGQWVRDVTNADTGKPTQVSVDPSTVDQKLIDAAQARKLAMEKVKADTEATQAKTEKTTPQEPDENGAYDQSKPGWKGVKTGHVYTKSAPEMDAQVEVAMAGTPVDKLLSSHKGPERDEFYTYLKDNDIDPHELSAASAAQVERVSESRVVGRMLGASKITSQQILSEGDVLSQRADELAKAVPDTGIVPLNALMRRGANAAGSEAVAAFHDAVNTYQTKLAASLSPTGSPTVASIEKASHVINDGMTVKQIKAVIANINQENIRKIGDMDKSRENNLARNQNKTLPHPEVTPDAYRQPNSTPKSGGSLFDHIMGQ